MNVLTEFVELFGLHCNPTKSVIFMCAIDSDTKECLLELTRFKLGSWLVRYLRVPLVSSQLSTLDCSLLVEIITHRISHWTSRFLSYIGWL